MELKSGSTKAYILSYCAECIGLNMRKSMPLGALIRTRPELLGFLTISNVSDLPGVAKTEITSTPLPGSVLIISLSLGANHLESMAPEFRVDTLHYTYLFFAWKLYYLLDFGFYLIIKSTVLFYEY